ncbi:MAG TPA: histidine kinase dimerization/phospho-acceptor domain-containing protein, partial [Usitatibacteraceae bacterium]|nr:histidine kinase dimerization/phospho-acceptor domain-containing protein [Usitatibacteraceae bacterium]
MVSFLHSLRVRLLVIAVLLLLIPLIGFGFVRAMDQYLREAHQQTLVASARALALGLSDRPGLFAMPGEVPDATEESGGGERRRLLALFGAADPSMAVELKDAFVPSREIERIVSVAAKDTARTWVVDQQSRVRGLAGLLGSQTRPRGAQGFSERLHAALVRPVLRWLSPGIDAPTADDPARAQLAVMAQVDRALNGEPTVRRRAASGDGGEIVSVAQPIWQGERIVGAVVLEETTGDSQALKAAALESLLAISAVVVLVGFLALLHFAWRLTSRVSRLQRAAQAAIDVHGRVRDATITDESADELGALSRTLEASLQRQKRYSHHLERMAARLSHELRTPVAVVRSSLDNLRQARTGEDLKAYLDRADEGVRRLSSLITRMSEASRLETMLSESHRELFSLARLVSGCVDGYRGAFAPREITLKADATAAFECRGIPDAIAQLLDKLVQNAHEFATPGTPIEVALRGIPPGDRGTRRIGRLSVSNFGPQIAPELRETLFSSMLSMRDGPQRS